MALTKPAFLREDNNLNGRIPTDAFLLQRIKDAKRKLKRLVGSSAYAAAENTLTQESPDVTSDAYLKAEAFQNAESKLVMYYALPILNIHLTEQGVILSADSNQFGANVQAASPKQLEAMQAMFLKQALDAIQDYVPVNSVIPVASA